MLPRPSYTKRIACFYSSVRQTDENHPATFPGGTMSMVIPTELPSAARRRIAVYPTRLQSAGKLIINFFYML